MGGYRLLATLAPDNYFFRLNQGYTGNLSYNGLKLIEAHVLSQDGLVVFPKAFGRTGTNVGGKSPKILPPILLGTTA